MATAVRLTAIAAAALVAVSAGPASARSTSIGFTVLPQHVVQGNDAKISVRVRPVGARCTLSVRYQGGALQGGIAAATAVGGRVSWTWHVPIDVQAGSALATVRCAHAGSASRSLVIVGRLVEPKIVVMKQGFSIRPNSFGTGSRLSYGLILHNGSPARDAQKVTIQVNFVMADDHLLGTDTQHVDDIGAGSDWALGNSVSFPGAAPITRLEVVIQVASFAPQSIHVPTLAEHRPIADPAERAALRRHLRLRRQHRRRWHGLRLPAASSRSPPVPADDGLRRDSDRERRERHDLDLADLAATGRLRTAARECAQGSLCALNDSVTHRV
jgi:hypothetical protein